MTQTTSHPRRRRRDPPDRGGDLREGPRAGSADQRGLRAVGELTLVSVLKGSLPFMADLMRAIEVPVRIDLMEVSSYGGSSTESSGLVRILKDLSASIVGRRRPDRRGHHRHRAHAQLPDPLPARQGPGLAADLHAARQACPPARRDQRGLHGLHDPRPVRRWLRPRLRRALSEPALRGRPAPGGLLRGALASDHAPPAAGPGSDARCPGRAPDRDRLHPPLVAGRRDARHHREAGNGFDGSGILVFLVGTAGARTRRPAVCRRAIDRSRSIGGCRSPSWPSLAGSDSAGRSCSSR